MSRPLTKDISFRDRNVYLGERHQKGTENGSKAIRETDLCANILAKEKNIQRNPR